MSGQSSQQKGGYGQPVSYGQSSKGGNGSPTYGYGPQQGSFFSAGGSSRTPFQTLPYQIPDSGIPQGLQNPLIMDTGAQFGSNLTGYTGIPGMNPAYPSTPGSQATPQFNALYGAATQAQGPTGAQIMAGGNPYYNSAAQSAAQAAMQAASNPFARSGSNSQPNYGYSGLSTQGTTQAQQGMGIGMTPQGTLSFAPSGNLNQIPASTASLMGARNDGQGHWVNPQGQVIGLV